MVGFQKLILNTLHKNSCQRMSKIKLFVTRIYLMTLFSLCWYLTTNYEQLIFIFCIRDVKCDSKYPDRFEIWSVSSIINVIELHIKSYMLSVIFFHEQLYNLWMLKHPFSISASNWTTRCTLNQGVFKQKK